MASALALLVCSGGSDSGVGSSGSGEIALLFRASASGAVSATFGRSRGFFSPLPDTSNQPLMKSLGLAPGSTYKVF